MTYEQALDYLLGQLPIFQRVGPAAYKANLDNTFRLSNHLGNPEKKIKCIHVAGTNGKGSVSHMLASALQAHGYKTALATSPHLKDFRERIRINGRVIPEYYVCDFVAKNLAFFKTLQASFFEIAIALTFTYFADEKVDIAVIETGLGGRLDSTNIIIPEVSVITNIGYDHTRLLGSTLEKIAYEKAGIIKNHIPAVIGRRQESIHHVFEEIALKMQSELIVADETCRLIRYEKASAAKPPFVKLIVEDPAGHKSTYQCDLLGNYQKQNVITALAALRVLGERPGFQLQQSKIKIGLARVVENTGLMGRWQQIRNNPDVICDTAHNADGLAIVVDQLLSLRYERLRMVFGVVNDKDLDGILSLLPASAAYYFCAPAVPRALPANDLAAFAEKFGLRGSVFPSVQTALEQAIEEASVQDLIFVGGSTFVVAEVI